MCYIRPMHSSNHFPLESVYELVRKIKARSDILQSSKNIIM